MQYCAVCVHEATREVHLMRFYRKLNIMDNMLTMMEKYANNLEELVEVRTAELVEEKKKTDMLLYRMLPEYVFTLRYFSISSPPDPCGVGQHHLICFDLLTGHFHPSRSSAILFHSQLFTFDLSSYLLILSFHFNFGHPLLH